MTDTTQIETGHYPVRVDKSVPYPGRRRSKRFPFESMEVGDSFLTDTSSKSLIYFHMRRHAPKRFISRTVREPSGFGLRVWRIL